MKLSQTVIYAIHAVARLAGETTPVTCKVLAERGKMPTRFLLQILRDLAKYGVVNAARGASGGFQLARPPEEISLLEVIEAIDGPLKAAMPMKANFPDSAAERVEEMLQEINETTRKQLQAVTLADLLKKGKRG